MVQSHNDLEFISWCYNFIIIVDLWYDGRGLYAERAARTHQSVEGATIGPDERPDQLEKIGRDDAVLDDEDEEGKELPVGSD